MKTKAKQILVVEDNVAMAGVVRFNFQHAGLDVTVARNGQEGWDYLKETDFDLVVVDYQMPGMDGRELCRRIRESPRCSRIPVLMVTAKELELDLSRLREEFEILEIFSKPFSPRELTQAVLYHLAPVAC